LRVFFAFVDRVGRASTRVVPEENWLFVLEVGVSVPQR
jgi:hypothetical protein